MINRDLAPMTSTLTGFTGDAITPVGIATLPVTFDDEPRTKTLMVYFMVADLPSAYNVIIERPTLNMLRAVIFTYHHSMKFPTSAGPGEIKSDPQESRRCYLVVTSIPRKGKKALVPDPREPHRPDTRPKPSEPTLEVPLEKAHPKRTVRVEMPELMPWLGRPLQHSRRVANHPQPLQVDSRHS
ncbi:hypothetical protein B296_00027439 [Ensete ventricosum]|uniref:Uncharacterized protein n=1 Tax=Ensete ventricosum TaxID=4639 RepID=A0A427A5X8_ENSVE|nr:hypothetical protein B296_00027439 [Ensete ventricosum]